jgi:hypothetical protein
MSNLGFIPLSSYICPFCISLPHSFDGSPGLKVVTLFPCLVPFRRQNISNTSGTALFSKFDGNSSADPPGTTSDDSHPI